MAQSDSNSPPNQAFARKNKLGYTRISIACSHCRRRKIRCVASPNENEHRCANCIKLKKECVFTSVDSATGVDPRTGSAHPGLGSRTSSAMSSHSPSGISQDLYHMPESELHSAASSLPITPGGYPSSAGVMTSQGLGISPNSAPHDGFNVGHGVPEWQVNAAGLPQSEFASEQYPHSWMGAPQQMGYPTQPFPDGSHGLQQQFVGQGQPFHIRPQQPQWMTVEGVSTGQPHMAGVPAFAHQQMMYPYPGQFIPGQQGVAAAPVVPSQFLAPGMRHSADAETHPGWEVYPQGQARSAPSRHDSIATNWARVPSNHGRPVSGQGEQQQHPHRRQKHPNEY